MSSQAGESPPSAPQLSGLENEAEREVHKPVLKSLFAGKLSIQPLGGLLPDPLRPSASCCRDSGRGKLSSLALSQEMLPPHGEPHSPLKPLVAVFEDQCLLPIPSQSLGPLNGEMAMSILRGVPSLRQDRERMARPSS